METIAKFKERDFLVPQYTADEEMRKTRYHDMLRDDIHEFVSLLGWKTLEDMISRAREWEIDSELLKKRKSINV